MWSKNYVQIWIKTSLTYKLYWFTIVYVNVAKKSNSHNKISVGRVSKKYIKLTLYLSNNSMKHKLFRFTP